MWVFSAPALRRGLNGACALRSTHSKSMGAIALLSTSLSLVIAGAGPSYGQAQGDIGNKTAPVSLSGLQDAFISLADEIEPAVVTISATTTVKAPEGAPESPRPGIGIIPRRSVGTGSGVVVRANGWILTNDHVVEDADRVTVRFHDGRELPGTVFRDPRSDLAVIKVESTTPLPVARIGDSDKVRIGQWAIAIGSPYRYEGSFSVGVISSLFRRQEIGNMTAGSRGHLYPNMIQTDAAINPGNSGGPLCNLAGEVIAINTAIESERGGGSVGIGFAIPINTAKFVMNQLIDKGKVTYGYLGVSPTSVTPRSARALKVDQGALIDLEPRPDSPAGKAGLKAGDVVVAIDGKPVRNEIDLRTIVSETAPESRISLVVVRDGNRQTVAATLGRVEQEDPVSKPHPAVKGNIGLEVQSLTDRLADRAGVPRATKGVYIKAVDPASSAADDEELTERCVIVRVNDKDTPTAESFQAAVSTLKPGDQVGITFLKNSATGFVKRFAVITVD